MWRARAKYGSLDVVLTRQEIFDRVAEHASTQNRPCVSKPGEVDCAYRGNYDAESCDRCYLGIFIPDPRYESKFDIEGVTPCSLLSEFEKGAEWNDLGEFDQKFIIALQWGGIRILDAWFKPDLNLLQFLSEIQMVHDCITTDDYGIIISRPDVYEQLRRLALKFDLDTTKLESLESKFSDEDQ